MTARFLKISSGLALAAAMAASPALAQRDGRGWQDRSPEAGAEARVERMQQRNETREVPQARVQAEAQPTARSWNGGDRGGRGDGGNGGASWRGRGDAAARVQAPAQVQTQSQASPSWSGRRSNDGTARSWRGSAPAAPAAAPQAETRRSDNGWANRGNGSWQGNRGGDNRGTDQARRTDNRRGEQARTPSWQGRTGNDGRYRNDNTRWSDNRGGWNGNRGNDYRRWDRNDWRRDNRYNWNSYRNQHRSTFNLGIYYAPYRNYYYRPFGIGSILDGLFYSDRYWINDPWQYRLPEVYGPYRWVRYYDDVLLVDIYTGEVVDVIHDFFW